MKTKRGPMVTISFKKGRSTLSTQMEIGMIGTQAIGEILNGAIRDTRDRLQRELDRIEQRILDVNMEW